MNGQEVITLTKYIDSCVEGLKKNIEDLGTLVQQQFAMNDKALKLANEAMMARLESMNEFRAQIKEERGSLATKENLVSVYDKLDQRIKPLETMRAVSSGQMKLMIGIFSAIPTVLALIALFRG